MIIYTVRPGDTLDSVARQYTLSPALIAADNGIVSPLIEGQSLVLRQPALTYTVEAGDTLSYVAASFGTTENVLWQNNPLLGGRDAVYPGQTLVISYGPPTLGTNISLNGYAYTYISDDTLRRTLPYLTYLSVFSYGLNPDGTLVPPRQDDGRLIALARQYGAVPIMMLTSITAQGTFSNELINTVLQSEALTDSVITAAANTVREKGYGGIETDFEYISAENAQAYIDFVSALKAELGSGYTVFTDLAPKTSAAMPGLLYEAHNYPALGEAADFLFLMTYEWGYSYGPPMAVSPINNVRRVLDYAVSEIPREKLFMGHPSYGYDWPLPYERGVTAAQSLSSREAIELAAYQGVPIQFDTEAMAPYFNYTEDGIDHIVWFQDARSTEALASLADEYSLGGIGVWNIMRPFQSMWSVISGLYGINKL